MSSYSAENAFVQRRECPCSALRVYLYSAANIVQRGCCNSPLSSGTECYKCDCCASRLACVRQSYSACYERSPVMHTKLELRRAEAMGEAAVTDMLMQRRCWRPLSLTWGHVAAEAVVRAAMTDLLLQR